MTIERYKELKENYYCGTIYNNYDKLVKLGFYSVYCRPIPELDAELEVQRCAYPDGNQVFYRVYAPRGMKYEEV